MAQPLPIHSWKLIFPWVVSAVKFGASLLIRNAMTTSIKGTKAIGSRGRGQGADRNPDEARRFSRASSPFLSAPAPRTAVEAAVEGPGPQARHAGCRASPGTGPMREREPKISSRHASPAAPSWRAPAGHVAAGPRVGMPAPGAPRLAASAPRDAKHAAPGRNEPPAGEYSLDGPSPCGQPAFRAGERSRGCDGRLRVSTGPPLGRVPTKRPVAGLASRESSGRRA